MVQRRLPSTCLPESCAEQLLREFRLGHAAMSQQHLHDCVEPVDVDDRTRPAIDEYLHRYGHDPGAAPLLRDRPRARPRAWRLRSPL